jgi:restriction endonuclease Mrr
MSYISLLRDNSDVTGVVLEGACRGNSLLKLSKKTTVVLIDGIKLVEYIIGLDHGVTTTAKYVIKKVYIDYFTVD